LRAKAPRYLGFAKNIIDTAGLIYSWQVPYAKHRNSKQWSDLPEADKWLNNQSLPPPDSCPKLDFRHDFDY
jgi:hypothetical protein